MTPRTEGNTGTACTSVAVEHGDYVCSENHLYYVELVGPERVLLEDCRTGTLLDVSGAAVAELRRVTPAPETA